MTRPRGRIAIVFIALLIGSLIVGVTMALAADRGVWAPNVSYAVGDTVTYQDASHPNHKYQTIQAHTSQVGWEPPNVPALWQDLGAVGSTATNTPTKVPTAGPTPTKTNTPKPTATSGSGGGTCWAAWVSTTAYNGGAQVSRFSNNYQAAYWTQGDDP